jgi:hypothetical protein
MWLNGSSQSCDQITGIGSPDDFHWASVSVKAPGITTSPTESLLPNTETRAVNCPVPSPAALTWAEHSLIRIERPSLGSAQNPACGRE